LPKSSKKNGHKNKKTADQNKMLSGKMDTITMISARTRTENREWRKNMAPNFENDKNIEQKSGKSPNKTKENL